jgi:hypothetical protein
MKKRYVGRWINDFQTSEHRDEIKKSGFGMAVRIVCIELRNYRSAVKPSKIVLLNGPVCMWFLASLLLHVFDMVLNK